MHSVNANALFFQAINTPILPSAYPPSQGGNCRYSKITGGKIISTTSKKTTNRAAQAFRLATRSLYHSKSALGFYYRRAQAQHGSQFAIKATAHKLARIVYAMLKDRTEYHDLGVLYYEQCFKDESSTGSSSRRH